MRTAILGAVLALLLGWTADAHAAELRGSPRSMVVQHGVAKSEGFSFARSAEQLDQLAEKGKLEPVLGNENYVVSKQVVHRLARPEVKLFIERLSAQYREATGERLVVTSLVRPTNEQPRNAHRLSVHPAGMAVDLRVPASAAGRAWLDMALLGMERRGLIDATREYRPPHYHVAVFPGEYLAYAERRMEAEAERPAREAAATPAPVVAEGAPLANAQAVVSAGFTTVDDGLERSSNRGVLAIVLAGLLLGALRAGYSLKRGTRAD